jgi:ubiquinone/menaquinone biosynthesis C-methylase UbiE
MENKLSGASTFLDPEAIIKELGVGLGSIVADFGCGPGYFTIPMAKVVGNDGKVFALDVLPQALETTSSKARIEGLSNVVIKRVNLENVGGSKLENESVDWVVLKDMLFQNSKKENVIAEIYRILKIKGRVLIIEWDKQSNMVGPEQELRISMDELKKMVEAYSLIIEREIAVGDFHYGLVVEKQK